MDFQSLGLPSPLLASLEKMQFTSPTPVQEKTIPHALSGADVLGSAQTGTGKTAAFGIPLVAHLLNNTESTALVMTPTRELAVQVLNALQSLIGSNRFLKTALLIGGEPMFKQLRQLSARPHIVVGTPGRIYDHLRRHSLNLKKTNFLVLDETDRMLDMGFEEQLELIAEYLPQERQTLMFSATMPKNIEKMAQKYTRDAIRISVGATHVPAEKIKQENIHTQEGEKYNHLLTQLNQYTGSVIIFVKTKMAADRISRRLRDDEHDSDAIHGDLRQRHRDKVIGNFRRGKSRILVATDIAARGLDIPHIECVINYDLPQCAEDYIHRIGRTARAGAEGVAINFLSTQDGAKWKAIHRLLNPHSKEELREAPASRNRKTFKSSGDYSKFSRSKSKGDYFSSKKENLRSKRFDASEGSVKKDDSFQKDFGERRYQKKENGPKNNSFRNEGRKINSSRGAFESRSDEKRQSSPFEKKKSFKKENGFRKDLSENRFSKKSDTRKSERPKNQISEKKPYHSFKGKRRAA